MNALTNVLTENSNKWGLSSNFVDLLKQEEIQNEVRGVVEQDLFDQINFY